MLNQNEQPTLFELTACTEVEPLRGLAPEHAAPKVAPKSDPSVLEGKVFPRERQAFRAVSPLAAMSLREVCAACGREISGSGFVISRDPVPIIPRPRRTGLDYKELGAFCSQDCGDKSFRSYLYEAAEEGKS